jgi:hypothetical protein
MRTPVIPFRAPSTMPPFKWEDIDHSIVGLKLTNLAEEVHRQIKADERRIQFENLRNLSSFAVPSLVLEMKERRTEEFCQQAYEVYCGAWQTQEHAKSAAFLRAVYGGGILPALRARAGAIANDFARVAGRANFPRQVRNAHLEGLRARMHRLEDRWRRRIEAEAKECEHRERSGVQSQAVDFSQPTEIPPDENSPARFTARGPCGPTPPASKALGSAGDAGRSLGGLAKTIRG